MFQASRGYVGEESSSNVLRHVCSGLSMAFVHSPCQHLCPPGIPMITTVTRSLGWTGFLIRGVLVMDTKFHPSDRHTVLPDKAPLHRCQSPKKDLRMPRHCPVSLSSWVEGRNVLREQWLGPAAGVTSVQPREPFVA